MSIKLLDRDLAIELHTQVKAEGLLWDSLPLVLKMKYLNPYVTRQMAREQLALGGAVRGAA